MAQVERINNATAATQKLTLKGNVDNQFRQSSVSRYTVQYLMLCYIF